MPDSKESALALLPRPEAEAVERFCMQQHILPEEIRLRIGQAVSVGVGRREYAVPVGGRTRSTDRAILEYVLRVATSQSMYCAQTLREGYLTAKGGNRIGVCGTAVMENDAIRSIKDISSLNIRIAREVFGCAERLLNEMSEVSGSVLLVGPPGSGKTTLLRDFTRLLSDRAGLRVGLADERGELAAVFGGVPQLCVGSRTDVLTGCRKADAIELLVRTMNPDWIVLDEITAERDTEALLRASFCGVRFAASAHAGSMEELNARPLYRAILKSGIFQTVALLRADRSIKTERWNPDVDTLSGLRLPCSGGRSLRRRDGSAGPAGAPAVRTAPERAGDYAE